MMIKDTLLVSLPIVKHFDENVPRGVSRDPRVGGQK